MNVTIHREALLVACRLAGRLLPERPLGTAEEHFLLRTSGGGFRLHASGFGASLHLPLVARVAQAGEALLPARAALAILRAAPLEELSLERSTGSVVLRWPGACYRLQSSAGSSFPLEDIVLAAPSLLLSPRELHRAIRSTLFATGPCGRRYRLDGVLMEAEPDRLRVVATDNRRLAVAVLPARSSDQGFTPTARILPAVVVALLARLAETIEEDVRMAFEREQVSFQVGEAVLSCRAAEGPYPPWRKAVPAAPPCRLEVPVAGLLGAVRQAAVLRESQGARLVLTLEPGRLVLESGRNGAGCSRVARKVAYQGGAVRLALEPRYLVEMLRCLEDHETVELGLTDADTPALFRAGGYLHVLMPLRLH